MPLPLAVTMGDPAGIGLDIVIAAAARGGLPPFAVYGDQEAFRQRAAVLGASLLIEPLSNIAALAQVRAPGTLGVVPVPLAQAATPGKTDPRHAPAIIGAIELAVADVAMGRASAVVTCPIAKATLTAAGFKHPGHTEFLAELAGRHHQGRSFTPVMMLASDALRVVPATIHIPLAEVARRLDRRLVEATIRITSTDMTRWLGVARPRIAVAGLNPHAGESGTLGREEIEIISPAIATLRAEGIDVVGPLSADTMFHAAARRRYDVAVCMYHDQALIPIKTLAFDTGVNVTLGLPFIRTSPDHGTAFDIAGTGRADPASFIAAIEMAARMASHAKPLA